MTTILVAKNVVDIENIIAVLIIISIVLHTLARFGEDSTRIFR